MPLRHTTTTVHRRYAWNYFEVSLGTASHARDRVWALLPAQSLQFGPRPRRLAGSLQRDGKIPRATPPRPPFTDCDPVEKVSVAGHARGSGRVGTRGEENPWSRHLAMEWRELLKDRKRPTAASDPEGAA